MRFMYLLILVLHLAGCSTFKSLTDDSTCTFGYEKSYSSDNIKKCLKLADNGNIEAQYFIGTTKLLNKALVPINESRAIEFLEKSGRKGKLDSYFELGTHYEVLCITPPKRKPNCDKALYYIKMAANSGHHESITVLGEMYWRGHVVNKDYEKALHYLKLSYENGQHDLLQLIKFIEGELKEN